MKAFKIYLFVLILLPLFAFTRTQADRPHIVLFEVTPERVTLDGHVTVRWETKGFRHVWLHWYRRYDLVLDHPREARGSLIIPVSEISLPSVFPADGAVVNYFDLIASNNDSPQSSDNQHKSQMAYVQLDVKIDSFRVAPSTILFRPRETLTYSWAVTGASRVSLSVPLRSRRFDNELSNLPATGTYTLTVTPDMLGDAVVEYGKTIPRIFWPITLYAYSTARPDLRVAWGNGLDLPFKTAATLQMFEGGIMLWVKNTQQIYVLYNSKQWQRFNDTWQEGEPLSIASTPPADRLSPKQGFGKVWAKNRAVRNGLGWALSPEQGYEVLNQNLLFTKCRTYTLPDNRIVFLRTDTMRWSFDQAIC